MLPEYPYRPPELAYRQARRPDLAVPVAAEAARDADAAALVEERSAVTDRFMEDWALRAIQRLDEGLAKLAAFSQGQLFQFQSILHGAGVPLGDDHVPQPLGNFTWESVARPAVSALLDAMADSEDATGTPGQWAEWAMSDLQKERFQRATGIDESDHATVIALSADALLRGATGSEDLIYRDRPVALAWTEETISASHLSFEALRQRHRPDSAVLVGSGR